MDKSSRGGGGDRVTNSSKAPELIVRGPREVSDNMFNESKRTTQQ